MPQNSISNVPTIATSWRARALGHRWCSSFPKGSSATFARGVTLFRGKKNFQRIWPFKQSFFVSQFFSNLNLLYAASQEDHVRLKKILVSQRLIDKLLRNWSHTKIRICKKNFGSSSNNLNIFFLLFSSCNF